MNPQIKTGMEVAVNSLIERFDDLEVEAGADFTYAKRVILRWAEKHDLFIQSKP